MRLLLDTHAFLWFILDDPQLSESAKNIIADPVHEIVISPASYWQIAIKIKLGKYLSFKAITLNCGGIASH